MRHPIAKVPRSRRWRASAETHLFALQRHIGNAPRRHQVAFSNGLGSGICSGRLELPSTSKFFIGNSLFPDPNVDVQWWSRDPGCSPGAPVGSSDALRSTVLS